MKVSVLIALTLSFSSLAIPAFAEEPAKKLNILFSWQQLRSAKDNPSHNQRYRLY